MDISNIVELLGEVAVGDDSYKDDLCIFVEMCGGLAVMHLVPLHGLIAASIGTGAKDASVYAWA